LKHYFNNAGRDEFNIRNRQTQKFNMQDNTLTVPDKTTGRENQKRNGKPHNPTRTKAKKVRKKSDRSQKRSDWKPSVKEQQPNNSEPHHHGNGAGAQSNKLTEAEKAAQAEYLERYRRGSQQATESFQIRAEACFRIQEEKLYREYPTQAVFFKAKLGLARSTGLRLADMGRLLNRLSPTGDNRLLTTDAHCRPLLKLSEADQNAAIEYAKGLAGMAGVIASAAIIEAAVTILYPPEGPKDEAQAPSRKLAEKFKQIVEKTEADLPKNVGEQVVKLFHKMVKQALVLGGPTRTTGIDWADSTWNPLAGCGHCSRGCDECFAAKDAATRLADVYPGLAKKAKIDGNETYAFTGKIVLLPERLANPLRDRVPKRYFVNSMSDLFHPKVPDVFIEAVFDVMEKAYWHVFQVLTKRPERMAAFSQKRYKGKQPPKKISGLEHR